MKKIIKLTERDLTRIVKRIINERQYLMEDDVRKVIPIEIAIPAVKNQKTGKLEPKSDTAYLSYFAKNEPGKNGMSSLMNETNFLALKFGDIECSKPSGCLKTSKKDDQGNIVGSIYADQKLLNVLKTWVGQTDSSGSLGMMISTQGPSGNTVIGSPKVYYKEIQPTQKESDLTRIVKRVINERQYLSEQTIASTQAAAFVNEFNRVMTAYKLPAYTAKYVKGADDYHGNIVIYKDGKELAKSPQDFGIAVTANLSPGVQQEKDPLDNYSTKLVDGKLMQFNTSLVNVLNTADAAAKNQLATAVRSGVDAVRKQLSPTQK